MREALTLASYKAAEERHWDEAEEDDEEDRPADHTLGLRAAREGSRRRGESQAEQQLPALTWATYIFFLDVLLRSIPNNLAEMK